MRNFASKHESMDKLIGRDKEHAELERCLNSDRSELVIVYVENIKSLDPLLYSHLTHQKYIRIK
mgnify:CR=1 FL=1